MVKFVNENLFKKIIKHLNKTRKFQNNCYRDFKKITHVSFLKNVLNIIAPTCNYFLKLN